MRVTAATRVGRLPEVLDPPVDPEPLGVLAGDPEHVGPVVEHDLEVVVGDAAAEHLDLRLAAWPDPLDHLLDPHRG